MFKRLIVPLDGSRLAEAVLPAASFVAKRLGVTVVLLHIIEKNPPQKVHGEAHLAHPDEAMAYLQEIALRFPPEIEIETHVHEAEVDDVAASIFEHTIELSSDLIAMCTHGRGGLAGWLVGNIAQQVIGMGSVPVLLISPDAPAGEFNIRDILIPLDGSPEHEHGLEAAQEISRCCPARIDLLQVVPTLGTLKGGHAAVGRLMPGSTNVLLDMAEEDARAHLAEHVRELEQAGVDVTAKVMRGDPAEQIVQLAERLSVDLIVLTTHGKSGQDAFWEGSVAPRIPGRTRIPLLLVPVGKTEQ